MSKLGRLATTIALPIMLQTACGDEDESKTTDTAAMLDTAAQVLDETSPTELTVDLPTEETTEDTETTDTGSITTTDTGTEPLPDEIVKFREIFRNCVPDEGPKLDAQSCALRGGAPSEPCGTSAEAKFNAHQSLLLSKAREVSGNPNMTYDGLSQLEDGLAATIATHSDLVWNTMYIHIHPEGDTEAKEFYDTEYNWENISPYLGPQPLDELPFVVFCHYNKDYFGPNIRRVTSIVSTETSSVSLSLDDTGYNDFYGVWHDTYHVNGDHEFDAADPSIDTSSCETNLAAVGAQKRAALRSMPRGEDYTNDWYAGNVVVFDRTD
ncbi:hypothetical protein HOD30_00275 [Candidatus Peregrinibacteria bacterium]|jgi:hypothetical protein|nr:hypothetical protein [Candidatus Peregrinibacteria bacterium]MBT4631350.1 hypothetical protein [Candidatus Peregrinibacteria bacterium]MBT5517193.1 hypothetical protein [Candidatus Peregrinibacteria bacterium]MBT5823775.1 hypothetical protein [Candidatus Peregrinibacteria bacterium]